MAKRWRKNPRPTGLARIGAGEQGSTLWDGELKLASVSYSDGEFGHPVGWWWSCPSNQELGVKHQNHCYTPFATEKEAKAAAKAYIDKCTK